MKLKMIQVGLGAHGMGIGVDYVQPSEDFEYAGLVDINVGKLKAGAELLNVLQNSLYTDYQEAFAELKADAVLISAVSPLHYEICKEAFNAGLHVLVEKPFVTNIQNAYELVETAQVRNLRLMVSQNYRYINRVVELKRAILNKAAGMPLYAKGEFYYNHLGKPYQCEMENFMLLEMAVHHIDMMRYLFDSNIKQVNGKTWNISCSMYQGDTNVHANYELDNGMNIFYLGSLVSKGLATPWEGIWRVQCEYGSLHLDDLGEGYGVYMVNENGEAEKLDHFYMGEKDSIHAVLAEFAAAIKEKREPAVSGRDNLNTLAAIFATSDSSMDGGWKKTAEQVAAFPLCNTIEKRI